MRFVRPTLLEVLICLAIIIILAVFGGVGSHPPLRPWSHVLKIKERALTAQRAGHPLQVQDVQGILRNQNWSGYEIALSGASNDWTVAFSTKKTKGFGDALWRMLGIAQETSSGSLSSSNLVNKALD